MVYVKDVAQVIVKILRYGPAVWNQAYNLGFDRTFSLKEVVEDIAKELEVEGVEFDTTDPENAFQMYPSVLRGGVDISKAQQRLGFVPTPWLEVLRSSVEFYDDAMMRFPNERVDVMNRITQALMKSTSHKEQFLDGVAKDLDYTGNAENLLHTEL